MELLQSLALQDLPLQVLLLSPKRRKGILELFTRYIQRAI
jgi:hypothetical protein